MQKLRKFAKATYILFIVKILAYKYLIFNDQIFNDTLTNDIVGFEQLGPDIKNDEVSIYYG